MFWLLCNISSFAVCSRARLCIALGVAVEGGESKKVGSEHLDAVWYRDAGCQNSGYRRIVQYSFQLII
jgi:hypothetical protein